MGDTVTAGRSKTDLAENILHTYVESSSIKPGDPDWPEYKEECDSIRAVLRLIADNNRKNSRVGCQTPKGKS